MKKKKAEKAPLWIVNVPVAFSTAGEMVKFMRERAGLTQGQLAKKIKTKQPSIARLENSSKAPSLTTLFNISKACGFQMNPPYFACKKCGLNISECKCKK